MEFRFEGSKFASLTDQPMHHTPRLLGGFLVVAPYNNREEREEFLNKTFGSQGSLWDQPDFFRFATTSRQLVGVEFRIPEESAPREMASHLLSAPEVLMAGVRADDTKDFRHDVCTIVCRSQDDSSLSCVRDLDVFHEPLEARIGIAPDVFLLVQKGVVVGWSLVDPVRHLTASYSYPDPTAPSPHTRRLFRDCLDLITTPAVNDLVDEEPKTLAKLRDTAESLRNQQVDRHRAKSLLHLISTYVEDYC